MTLIKTKAGRFTLAMLLIITGLLLDMSGNVVAQALHHLFFFASGVAVGMGFRTKQ